MKISKFALFVIFALIVLGLRFYFALPQCEAGEICSFLNGNLKITGKIITAPDTSTSSRFILKAEKFEQFGNWYPLKGLVYADVQAIDYEYGDTLQVQGAFTEPKYRYPIVDAYVKNPSVTVLGKNGGNIFFKYLFRFKKFLTLRFAQLYPEPAAGFLPGILLGSKSAIPKMMIDDFKKTGLSHIIALSGFNIVILISFVSSLLSFLPRKISTPVCIAVIIVFTMLVGAGASVLRAAIMGSLTLVAKLFGRKAAGMRTLFLTAYVMAFFDPLSIAYDIGFQLSFAATAGILIFTRRFQEFFGALPNFFAMRDSFATTLAAQVFTLPIIFFYFRGVSLIAPVSNILVLPFIPILMLGGALSLVLGKIAAAPTWVLFQIVNAIIHSLAAAPFSFMSFPTDWGI